MTANRIGLMSGGLAAAIILLAANVQGDEGPRRDWNDNFAVRPAGSDATPDWDPQTVGWEIRDSGYVGDGGMSVWCAGPLGTAVKFACDVTVLEQLKGDWLTAGIGLAADDNNDWAMNLVIVPERLGGRTWSRYTSRSPATGWPSPGGNAVAAAARQVPLARLAGQQDLPLRSCAPCRSGLRRDFRGGPGGGLVRLSPQGRCAGRAGRTADSPRQWAAGAFHECCGYRDSGCAGAAGGQEDVPPLGIARRQADGQGEWVLPHRAVEGDKELAAAEAARLEAHPQARWWLLDPEGRPMFDVGTDHVNYRPIGANRWATP